MTGMEPQSVDAFHRGRFVVLQPVGRGHRSGVDAMLVAAAVPAGFAGKLADFGAGAGAAGIAAAVRCPASHVILVERDPEMAEFARRSITHAANAGLCARLSLIEADVALAGQLRADSGLCDRSFNHVIMNPPFNRSHDRASPDRLKSDAHVMPDGLCEDWLRSAAAVLKPGGGLSVIARPAMLNDLLSACKGRFGAIRIVPVLPRPDEPAIRIVLTGIGGSRAQLSLEPPLVLHGKTGNAFSARANSIINGEAGLFDPPLQRAK